MQITLEQFDNLRSKVIAKIEQDIQEDDYQEVFHLLSFLPIGEMINYTQMHKEYGIELGK